MPHILLRLFTLFVLDVAVCLSKLKNEKDKKSQQRQIEIHHRLNASNAHSKTVPI